ncbi:class I SAM-dependent methyltransferase [Streptomyces sp. NPDC088387]|uniref:class I SAM-dependent methyltransferase n=1 Tax=Streptomyces sp. NPDC088387 TaxID=3365859 RepID=UPI00380B4787
MTEDHPTAPPAEPGQHRPAAASDEQTHNWNGDDGRRWVRHRERYERMQRHFTPHLLRAAAVGEADRVLDIGCGAGAVSRTVARNASRGHVLGVDVSEPLLAEARRLAREEAVENVAFEEGDAQTYPFPDGAFDLVISRNGVMFFSDPSTAFANIAGAVRPGGRLVFTCWQQAAANEWLVTLRTAVAPYVRLPDMDAPGKPGAYSLADPERVRKLLTGAGFTDIALEPVTEPMPLGDDPDDAVAFMGGLGMLRDHFERTTEESARQALAALRTAYTRHQGADGVALGASAWVVTARAPG